MLTGEFNILLDNMWLTDIISVVLLILPFFLVFYDKKWIFAFYVVSIVANLPLIFVMSFGFSYEFIIAFAIIISMIKELIIKKTLRYVQTKESIQFILLLILVLAVNLLTSLFNYNSFEYINRLFIYGVNLFIFFIFTYFLVNRHRLEIIKGGFIVGAIILVATMIVELIYGYKILEVHNMRPAGLLIDPNVSAFALNLTLIISFYKTRKYPFYVDIIIIAARVLIIFGIFLTVSRSAYISTIVILAMFLVYYSKGKDKWTSVTTVIIFVLMYLVFNNMLNNFIKNIYNVIDLDRIFPTSNVVPPDNFPSPGGGIIVEPEYSNSRITLIKAAFVVFINNFLVGVGIGNVVNEIYSLTGLSMNAHNLFLQLLSESGIIMLAILLIFSYYVIQLIFSSKSKTRFFVLVITVIIFIESLFNHNILNINIIWLILAYFVSMIVINSKEQKIYSISKETFKRDDRKKSYRRRSHISYKNY